MSFFDRQPPSLRELIAYVIGRARGRGATLNRTKLVKLLYLVDVELVGSGRPQATGLEWVFFHYGPWAFALSDELDAMEGREISTRHYGEAILYASAQASPDAGSWPANIAMKVDHVIDHWAGEELNSLLDFVYFNTAPMRHAIRGEVLNLRLEYDARRERERFRALDPPTAPGDVADRLQRWRMSRRAKLSVPPSDAPKELAPLPEGPQPEIGLRGQLSVGEPEAG